MSNEHNTKTKKELYCKCGEICMYSMHKFPKTKLQLHHYPPFKDTKHTIYDESYIINERLHKKLHRLARNDPEAYEEQMERIKQNKRILERKKSRKR